MNIRECNLCHKPVDFDEPWCDHETMEESAWLDIRARRNIAIDTAVASMSEQDRLDATIAVTAIELGHKAGEALGNLHRLLFDQSGRPWDVEKPPQRS